MKVKCIPKNQNISKHLFLTVFTAVMALIPIGEGNIFGSEGDWYSQHVGVAETLRQTILETGTIFPQFTGMGAGCNIYDYAYYGLYRPDVLISCLMPQVEMKYIISVYALAGMIISVNLCFLWLKEDKLSVRASLAAAVIMATAACWYQSHHQIMFINYMPFLILTLISIDKMIKGKGITGMTVSLLMIYLHSFYYSISCLLVCFIYVAIQMKNISDKERVRVAAKSMFSAVISVGMASVLLLPTALDILSTSKDGGSFANQGLALLDMSAEGLLYSSYGCGLTLIVFYSVFMGMKRQESRLLAAVILLVMMVPVISLVLNGFLYARAKILIPFLPLAVWLWGTMMQKIWDGEEKPSWGCLLFCAIPLFADNEFIRLAAAADFILLATWIALMRSDIRKRHAMKILATVLMFIMPVATSLVVNVNEDYVSMSDQRQSRFNEEEIAAVTLDERYRFEIMSNNFVNCNRLAGSNVGRTSMYSSITDAAYADFYYEVMENPISIRQRVALLPSNNPAFLYFMGVRYILTDVNHLPESYEVISEKDGYVLAENEDVLPVAYGCSNVMWPRCREEIQREEKMEAVFAQTVIEGTDGEYVINLPRVLRSEILVIEFDVDSSSGKEVAIIINDMKNVLSADNAAYPNQNNHFTYIISSGMEMDHMEVKISAKDWAIDNLQIYTLEEQYLKNQTVYVPVLEEGRKKDGRTMFAGSVNMVEKGYFVTSYPFRKGYEITVDGCKVEYQKVNRTFLGFPLDEGEHKVRIRYTAPGFMTGLTLSAVSSVIMAAVWAFERKKRYEEIN